MVALFLNFLWNLHPGCIKLHCHQQCRRAFLFSTRFPVFACGFFDDGHSDWYEVIPHCNFDLHVSNYGPRVCQYRAK